MKTIVNPEYERARFELGVITRPSEVQQLMTCPHRFNELPPSHLTSAEFDEWIKQHSIPRTIDVDG